MRSSSKIALVLAGTGLVSGGLIWALSQPGRLFNGMGGGMGGGMGRGMMPFVPGFIGGGGGGGGGANRGPAGGPSGSPGTVAGGCGSTSSAVAS